MIGLAQFLIEPLAQLTVVPSWVAEARASANRVALVLSAPPLVPGAPGRPNSTPSPKVPFSPPAESTRVGPEVSLSR